MIWQMPTTTFFVVLISVISGCFPMILFLIWDKRSKSTGGNVRS